MVDRQNKQQRQTSYRVTNIDILVNEVWQCFSPTARQTIILFSIPNLSFLVQLFFRVQSSDRAGRLMDSNIWGVIARRVGNESFLRHVFPLLLGWLERGLEAETDACVGSERHQFCRVHAAALRQSEQAGIEEETQPATAVSPRNGRPSAVAPTNGKVGQAEQPSPGRRNAFDERADGGLTAASRVQVAAAASVSKEIFRCLGERERS